MYDDTNKGVLFSEELKAKQEVLPTEEEMTKPVDLSEIPF